MIVSKPDSWHRLHGSLTDCATKTFVPLGDSPRELTGTIAALGSSSARIVEISPVPGTVKVANRQRRSRSSRSFVTSDHRARSARRRLSAAYRETGLSNSRLYTAGSSAQLPSTPTRTTPDSLLRRMPFA